jgi:hypothetical protein
LAKGDFSLLGHYTEQARTDYRDVLYWAEYPPETDVDAQAEKRKVLEGLVRFNFSPLRDAPETWEDVQRRIELPSELLAELGTGGLPTRDELLALAQKASTSPSEASG